MIPRPEDVRRRLEEIERERRDLRQLLRLAERHHGEKPVDDGDPRREMPSMRIGQPSMKLETKQGG